jgi:hypothetical protein
MSRDSAAAGTAQPARIVFSLLHAGYLRHYAEPIRLLAERGHSVHICLYRHEENSYDTPLLQALLELSTVTAGPMPKRRHDDGWRGIAWLTRALVDVLRYADPRYDDAPALRARVAAKVRDRILKSRTDPVTRRVITRALAWIARRPNWTAAQRRIRLLARIEEAVPTSEEIDALLRRHGATAVLASPVVEIASPQVEFIKSAQRLGIPSAVAVASWDNLTSKGLLRVVPDRVLVWNEIQRRELEEMHGVPTDRVVVTGAQKFDRWFERTATTGYEAFATRVGLDSGRPFLLYLCSSSFIAPDELGFVRRWMTALRKSGDSMLERIGVVIRPHPQNTAQWVDSNLSPFENVVVWPRGGEHPDVGDAEAAFFDSMFHSTAVVGINTSAQIDAAIVGKSVFTIRAFSQSQEGTLHFHYLLRENGGFVRDAETLDDHVAQLKAAVADPEGQAYAIDSFVSSFVRPRGLDTPASPLVAEAIEELAQLEVKPRRLSPAALVLRAVMWPLATTLRLTSAIWIRTRVQPALRREEQRAAVSGSDVGT